MSVNTEKLINNLTQGKKLNLTKIKASIRQMVESVVRNPDAVLWLMRLMQSDNYIHEIVVTHHERMKGRGYPNGMKGQNINIYQSLEPDSFGINSSELLLG
jgi:hypothetical protein